MSKQFWNGFRYWLDRLTSPPDMKIFEIAVCDPSTFGNLYDNADAAMEHIAAAGGSFRLFKQYWERYLIDTGTVDKTDWSKWETAFRDDWMVI